MHTPAYRARRKRMRDARKQKRREEKFYRPVINNLKEILNKEK